MQPILIAHRCGTERYPELTLDSAKHSLAAGASYVEMDIRFTKDGFPVISHDDNAEVLFGTPNQIDKLNLDEFLLLKRKGHPEYNANRFEDILQSEVHPLLLHIKEGGERLRSILALLRTYGYEDRTVLGLESVEDVKTAKDWNPAIPILAFMPSKNDLEDFARSDADILRLWDPWVSEELITKVKSFSKKVWIMAGGGGQYPTGYTSDEKLLFWKSLGVDGILVNEIQRTKTILSE